MSQKEQEIKLLTEAQNNNFNKMKQNRLEAHAVEKYGDAEKKAQLDEQYNELKDYQIKIEERLQKRKEELQVHSASKDQSKDAQYLKALKDKKDGGGASGGMGHGTQPKKQEEEKNQNNEEQQKQEKHKQMIEDQRRQEQQRQIIEQQRQHGR